MRAFYLYVNGQQVGYSQGSRLPAEFDVTGETKVGQQLVGQIVTDTDVLPNKVDELRDCLFRDHLGRFTFFTECRESTKDLLEFSRQEEYGPLAR